MKIELQLTQDDFVTHQLYVASITTSIRNRRKITTWIIPVLYGVLGGLLILLNQLIIGIALMIAGVIWLFFYPAFSRYRYRRHYHKYVKEHYKARLDRTVTLTLGPEFIETKDDASESKVQTSQVIELVILKQQYLIRLKSGQSFIVPKRYLQDEGAFQDLFRGWAIDISDKQDWSWK